MSLATGLVKAIAFRWWHRMQQPADLSLPLAQMRSRYLAGLVRSLTETLSETRATFSLEVVGTTGLLSAGELAPHEAQVMLQSSFWRSWGCASWLGTAPSTHAAPRRTCRRSTELDVRHNSRSDGWTRGRAVGQEPSSSESPATTILHLWMAVKASGDSSHGPSVPPIQSGFGLHRSPGSRHLSSGLCAGAITLWSRM